MSIVRSVIWVAATLLFAWFSATNWTVVPLVFGQTEVLIRLPVLLLGVVVGGIVLGALAGGLRRRRRTRAAAIAATEPAPRVASTVMPAEAQPTIVPPGCG